MAGRRLFLTILTVTFLATPTVARAPLSYAEGDVDPAEQTDAVLTPIEQIAQEPLLRNSWAAESISRPERRRALARSIAGTPAVISGPRPGMVTP